MLFGIYCMWSVCLLVSIMIKLKANTFPCIFMLNWNHFLHVEWWLHTSMWLLHGGCYSSNLFCYFVLNCIAFLFIRLFEMHTMPPNNTIHVFLFLSIKQLNHSQQRICRDDKHNNSCPNKLHNDKKKHQMRAFFFLFLFSNEKIICFLLAEYFALKLE